MILILELLFTRINFS